MASRSRKNQRYRTCAWVKLKDLEVRRGKVELPLLKMALNWNSLFRIFFLVKLPPRPTWRPSSLIQISRGFIKINRKVVDKLFTSQNVNGNNWGN
ncbi:unnamed protein product [Tenebrio molitor]|nr:unnamed protein product [Tenebrio molitor]